MKNYLLLSFLFISCIASAQRSLEAVRTTDKISIDGVLDEAIWEKVPKADDFTNWQPLAGEKPEFTTEVGIIYDDNAIYFGCYMQADSRDDIMTQLTERDDVGNTDFIGIIIDTYGNGTEGSEFILGATGVQFDAKVTNENGEDTNWNEVWYSSVKLTDKGWYAEIKIPYSALRFPKAEIQEWRFNILRSIPSKGAKCSYQYLDPEVQGWVNQTAYLKGLSNIKSPIRLSLSPYFTTYMQNNYSPNGSPSSSTGYSYNGGLDLKYGINEAFTLDMTLIPDFGQVQSDDRILNLSPFEVRYDENRAFFTEGVELFNKANIFYSRRVGGTPQGYHDVENTTYENEELIENPKEIQLYNATKISGRTKSGLGVGVFNAVAGATEAKLQNSQTDEIRNVTTSPLTNYNVVVFDQNLPNNSSVALINTSVVRRGAEFYDANVTGTAFNLKNKEQSWQIAGEGSFSQQLIYEEDNITGVNYEIGIQKISGKVNYGFEMEGVSKNYNSNDLGFNTYTNQKEYSLNASYRVTNGYKFFNRGNIWFNTFMSTTYDTNEFASIHFNSGFWGETKGLWNINMWTNYRPDNKDFFEPRVDGRYLKRPGFYNMGYWIGTDNRKKLRLSTSIFGMKLFEKGAHIYEVEVEPRYRFNDKLTIATSTSLETNKNNRGFVTFSQDEPIIGRRNRTTIRNVVGATYTFNSTISMNIRARHYWSKVTYDSFHGLDENGELTDSNYKNNNDFSFNLLNVDMNFSWRFAPGSDLIFNWKNNIAGVENNLTPDFESRNYFNGLNSLNSLDQVNSLSIRLVYFLNGQNIF